MDASLHARDDAAVSVTMAGLQTLGPFAHSNRVAAGGDVSTIAQESHLLQAVARQPPALNCVSWRLAEIDCHLAMILLLNSGYLADATRWHGAEHPSRAK